MKPGIKVPINNQIVDSNEMEFKVEGDGLLVLKIEDGTILELRHSVLSVDRVQIHQDGTRILVDVEMSTFDRVSRRHAYAKEWQLYKEYPGYTFDVRLIDQSPRQTNDAIQG